MLTEAEKESQERFSKYRKSFIHYVIMHDIPGELLSHYEKCVLDILCMYDNNERDATYSQIAKCLACSEITVARAVKSLKKKFPNHFCVILHRRDEKTRNMYVIDWEGIIDTLRNRMAFLTGIRNWRFSADPYVNFYGKRRSSRGIIYQTGRSPNSVTYKTGNSPSVSTRNHSNLSERSPLTVSCSYNNILMIEDQKKQSKEQAKNFTQNKKLEGDDHEASSESLLHDHTISINELKKEKTTEELKKEKMREKVAMVMLSIVKNLTQNKKLELGDHKESSQSFLCDRSVSFGELKKEKDHSSTLEEFKKEKKEEKNCSSTLEEFKKEKNIFTIQNKKLELGDHKESSQSFLCDRSVSFGELKKEKEKTTMLMFSTSKPPLPDETSDEEALEDDLQENFQNDYSEFEQESESSDFASIEDDSEISIPENSRGKTFEEESVSLSFGQQKIPEFEQESESSDFASIEDDSEISIPENSRGKTLEEELALLSLEYHKALEAEKSFTSMRRPTTEEDFQELKKRKIACKSAVGKMHYLILKEDLRIRNERRPATPLELRKRYISSIKTRFPDWEEILKWANLEWDEVEYRMERNFDYDPFENIGQYWTYDCHNKYGHLREEERNKVFAKEACKWLDTRFCWLSERTLKMLAKARAMADERMADYEVWCGAIYFETGRKIRHTHFNCFWAPDAYQRFVDGEYFLPQKEGCEETEKMRAKGQSNVKYREFKFENMELDYSHLTWEDIQKGDFTYDC